MPVAEKSGQKPQTGKKPSGCLRYRVLPWTQGQRIFTVPWAEHPSVARPLHNHLTNTVFSYFSGLASKPERLQVEVFLHCTHNTYVPLCTLHSWYGHTWAAGPDALEHTHLLTACTGK